MFDNKVSAFREKVSFYLQSIYIFRLKATLTLETKEP
jgi:hypothetical protein